MSHPWLKTYFDYNDDYETCRRTAATLCIYLMDEHDPADVSNRLGVSPSRTQRNGETRNGKVKTWPTAWFLGSEEHVESKDLRRHIDWLLEKLGNAAQILRELNDEGATIVLSCLWVPASSHGGPMLDAKILQRIAALQIGIGFDIHFYEDDDEVHKR